MSAEERWAQQKEWDEEERREGADYCSHCNQSFGKNDLVDQPMLQCVGCEVYFCWAGYMAHECSYHKAETKGCVCCQKQTRIEDLVESGGEKICRKCDKAKPWMKKAAQG